ncbi:MAG: carbon monoxide dehydrogenase [Candidatus Omnitrophota bacterium]
MSALIIGHLAGKKAGSVLAVDADPNSTLHEALGVEDPETIVGVVEEIAKNMESIPQGVTKERFIEMKVQEALGEEKGYDLLVMGRPEGPGCYCYVNNLLREMIGRITKNYDFVVIDNAAGMEHISRRTTRTIDKLVLVSDHSVVGVRSAGRIHGLARELDIKIGGSFLVLNKVADAAEKVDAEVKKTALALAGTVPYSGELKRLSLEGRAVSCLEDKKVKSAVEDIVREVLK